MGYYIHRLLGERSLYEGDEIRGGNHSFLRTKQFSDPEVIANENSATLRFHLPSERIEKSEYPRKVDFSLDYRLAEDCVEVRFSFKNLELDRPAHLSFGLHPGFCFHQEGIGGTSLRRISLAAKPWTSLPKAVLCRSSPSSFPAPF
jgi:galactose mutarotase-like enzyme